MDDGTCPTCGQEYDRKVSLDPRGSKTVDVADADHIHVVQEKRPSGPTMKKLRADTEPYQYVGYIHQ